MSAVPKKKLCWNCEGNVARTVDNCPYCGVYLHATEIEEHSHWNPTYKSNKTEEISAPYAQASLEESPEESEEPEEFQEIFAWSTLLPQLKTDIFPILFLMMGSIFFLFGVVLFLFSENGTFTLQWKESQALYFLLFAFPLIGFGWKFLQQLDTKD